jgi:hypothetical protein
MTATLTVLILSPLMTSLAFNPATTFELEKEQLGISVNYDFPEITWTPNDADKNITF